VIHKRAIQLVILQFLLVFLFSCTTNPFSLERQYISLSKKVLPSVVEVISVGMKDSTGEQWFDFFQDKEENNRNDFESSGIGSGFIAESDGDNYYIITNKHVIGELEKVSILTSDNVIYSGEVLGVDTRFDFAVIKIISSTHLPVVKLNISNRLKIGQFVAAIGNPMGYTQSVSMGIISHLGRFGGPKDNLSDYIQTDAAINQGNSGGPLVDLKGNVIGINTWISSPSGGNTGLGFSIPIKNVYSSFRALIDQGEIHNSWFGISTGLIPGVPFYANSRGAFVYQVVDDSPAYIGGVRPGDIIKSSSGELIDSAQELILLISTIQSGDTFNLDIERDHEEFTLNIVLGESMDDPLSVSKKVKPGFILIENDTSLIIFEILAKSVAEVAGFMKNDIINSVNGKTVIHIEEFYRELNNGINNIIITRENTQLDLELNY